MDQNLFEFADYKAYLNVKLAATGSNRGQRSALAKHLKCQTAFVSAVLNAEPHFSLEHAIKINQFLNHTDEEGHYFMLLLQKGRAGSKSLADYFEKQLKTIRQKRSQVADRIGVAPVLSSDAAMKYYSSWHHAAIHIATAIPGLQHKEAIAHHLRLPLQLVVESLEFMVSEGLVKRTGDRFEIGNARIHLSKDSPLIAKHHSNWRQQAIQSVERAQKDALHYSAVYTISEEDYTRINSMLLKTLEDAEAVFRETKIETLVGFNIDFYRVV
jgi:uncharacterized protein (TIGR02147 family)